MPAKDEEMDYEDFDDEVEEEDMFPESEIAVNENTSASINSSPPFQQTANTNARRGPLPCQGHQPIDYYMNIATPGPQPASQPLNGPLPTSVLNIRQTHPSGYSWIRDEDAPGFGWKNKKATDDYMRAMDQIIDKDRMIGRKHRV